MKSFLIIVVSFLSVSAFAHGYKCVGEKTGENITVTLSANQRTLTVSTGTGAATEVKSYAVIKTVSRTGVSDQTFYTKEAVNLTVDDQYGDSLSLKGQTVTLTCQVLLL